jgi:hypothetical protein
MLNLNEPVDHDLKGTPIYDPLRDVLRNALVPVYYETTHVSEGDKRNANQ